VLRMIRAFQEIQDPYLNKTRTLAKIFTGCSALLGNRRR
jgi:hypothetical protein